MNASARVHYFGVLHVLVGCAVFGTFLVPSGGPLVDLCPSSESTDGRPHRRRRKLAAVAAEIDAVARQVPSHTASFVVGPIGGGSGGDSELCRRSVIVWLVSVGRRRRSCVLAVRCDCEVDRSLLLEVFLVAAAAVSWDVTDWAGTN